MFISQEEKNKLIEHHNRNYSNDDNICNINKYIIYFSLIIISIFFVYIFDEYLQSTTNNNN